MNSLNRFRPAKQFRCLPLVGKTSPFGYEQIVRAADGSHNYQPASELVGAFSAMNEKGRKEWKNLTGGTGITGALKFTSLVMSGRNDRSSSCAAAIRTNACSLSNGSGRNSEGWKDEH